MRSHTRRQIIMEGKKIAFDNFIRGSICCALAVGLLIPFKRLSGTLLPSFVVWFIAYMIYPLVKFFRYKLRFESRIIFVFYALFNITIIRIAIFYFSVPPMLAEIGRTNDLLVTYLTNGAYRSGTVPPTLLELIHRRIDFQVLNRILSGENIMNTIRETASKLWALVAESINILFSVFVSFITLLYVVFILPDYESIAEGWLYLLSGKYRTFASSLVNDIQDGMNCCFHGQALIVLCVGILFGIGLLIIDFPMAIALGLFIDALNMVPYLQIIGFLLTVMLATLKAADTGENFWVVLAGALVVFVAAQTIQDGFLIPRIMGKITGLSPTITLLSLSVQGSLLGMLGMIIILPFTTLMFSHYRRFIINKERMEYGTYETSDNQEIERDSKKQMKLFSPKSLQV